MKKHTSVSCLTALLPAACAAALMFGFSPAAPAQSSTKKPSAPAEKATSKAKEKSKAKPKEAAKDPALKAGKAAEIVKELTPAQKTKLLDLLNKGETEAIAGLPGIGETKAAAIKKARPFQSPDELLKIEGIGLGTLKDIVKHVKAAPPAPKGEKGKGVASRSKKAATPKTAPKK